MSRNFVTGSGQLLEIGRELGKGGEGAVYEVPSMPAAVAKLYNAQHTPDPVKQAKLRFMCSVADAELLNYAAWPQDTLHVSRNGPAIGFLMPKVAGRVPIHMLYSPAHRRQEYPNVAWDFLLFAARNTAAAFAAIHQHGHVLGDVNQGNVLVGPDSKVVLIDADSFQISAKGGVHLCKVGVAHFTPPELQGVSSFDKVARTSNHDNFGLALLIFHLLFGGRHPYSGVPLRSDAGEALEKDIQAYRYAYGPDAHQRGFKPPPNSIPINLVPTAVQAMFTLAFTENGARGARPFAQQWVNALDTIRQHLGRCSSTQMHVFPKHITRCPWCALEDQGVIYFLSQGPINFTHGSSGFVLAKVWGTIEAITPPPAISIPKVEALKVTPVPLPPGMKNETLILVLRVILASISIGLMFLLPKLLISIAVLGIGSIVLVGNITSHEYDLEKTRRKGELDKAQQDFERLTAQVEQINPQLILEKKKELAKLRDDYQQLPERERAELANLHQTAEARQRQQFLEKQFIDAAIISGVGQSKKAALRSFGIETAADVSWQKVRVVKGFGEVLTRAVVDWRKACERRFVFNSSLAVSEADKIVVRSRYANQRRSLEKRLQDGASDLQRVRQDMMAKANRLHPMLLAAGLKLAQAKSDLSVM